MQNKTWTVKENTRLDLFLREKLPSLLEDKNNASSSSENNPAAKSEVSNGKIRRLIIAGAVSVNGKQCRVPSYSLRPGSSVTIRLEEEKFFFEKQPEDIKYELTEKDVLFEDEYLIIVNKPAFFPTEETIVKDRGNMHQAVIDYLWKKNPALRNPPYAGIMHRLDRETSGVLLFTKTRTVNAAVHDMFESRSLEKRYRAVCTESNLTAKRKIKSFNEGDCFTAEDYIGRISPKSQACKIGLLPEARGGQKAVTDFTVAAVRNGLYYMDCLLHTGRTHQIRVQLSLSGLPISGDSLYGGSSGFNQLNNRIMLHARSLSFTHPVTGLSMTVTAPYPPLFEPEK